MNAHDIYLAFFSWALVQIKILFLTPSEMLYIKVSDVVFTLLYFIITLYILTYGLADMCIALSLMSIVEREPIALVSMKDN